jgi:hypothetical protein
VGLALDRRGSSSRGAPAGRFQSSSLPGLPSPWPSFSQPVTPWEFLAGFAAVEGYQAPPEVLSTMDNLLGEQLASRGKPDRDAALTSKCEEIVLAGLQGSRVSALEYWVRTGRCVQADYLIVPHLLYWEERAGGEWSAESPARVIFDLFLIDLAKGTVARRFHFDERQQSLVENVLERPQVLCPGRQMDHHRAVGQGRPGGRAQGARL